MLTTEDIVEVTSTKALKIAVLDNENIPELLPGWNTFSDLWKVLFDAARAEKPRLPISGYSITPYVAWKYEFPTIQELVDGGFDAVVLSGSASNVWEAEEKPWIAQEIEWTKQVWAHNLSAPKSQRITLIGGCFGHQIIHLTLGGNVGLNPNGWENGLVSVKFTPMGKLFFRGQGDSMEVAEVDEEGAFNHPGHDVMQAHGASVIEPAEGFVTLASTEITPHQATLFRDTDGKVTCFTFQWHPEFPFKIVCEVIDLFRKVLPEEVYPSDQFARERASVDCNKGAHDPAEGSIPTARKTLEVIAGLV